MTTSRTRRGLLATALLVTALWLPTPAMAGTPAEAPGSATGSYLAGRFAQHHDDWRAAAQYLSHALSADPDELSLLRRTYMLRLSEGRIEAALDLAQRLVERDAEPQIAATLLIADSLARDRLDDAEAMSRRMPRDGMAKFLGPLLDAWLAVARKDTERAVQALSALTAATGFSALHNLHAGLVLDLGGRPADAERHYAEVVKTEAPLRVVQIVGNHYERVGRKDEARKLYERFRADNPDSLMIEPALKTLDAPRPPAPTIADARQGMAEALFDLGSALHHEGAEETALLFGRIALHLRPDLALARIMIGDIMEARDHHDEALAEYKTLENDPVLGWSARLRAADVLARMERHDEASAMFARLAQERPERTDALVRLGDVYRAGKRYDEAAATYTTALERIGTPAERHWSVFYARALAYDRINRWPDAEADLKKALELRPDEPYLLNYLGYSWVDKGQDLERAKAMIERAVELKPRDGYIIDSLGWALYRTGDFEGAVTRLERAVELRPVDATINDHLGDAYWRVGRRNEARFQWQRALRTADEEPLKQQIEEKLEKGLSDTRAAEAGVPKTQ
ncbi:MAG TPA: tetratricopeptide repeat protein [Azospirillum sp.]|nr:tetratricopeptide repeat protein [Azospirillum sp.]